MVENKAARKDRIQRLTIELEEARHCLASAIDQTKAGADIRTRVAASARRNPIGWGVAALVVVAAVFALLRSRSSQRHRMASGGQKRNLEDWADAGGDVELGDRKTNPEPSAWSKSLGNAMLASVRTVLPIAIKALVTGPSGQKLVKSIISSISRP